LPSLTLNHHPPDICLLNSQDYRRESLTFSIACILNDGNFRNCDFWFREDLKSGESFSEPLNYTLQKLFRKSILAKIF
jgi:hypothetical protein